ncbi:hypothetical protein MKW94_023041 [Papaver nudicaule]|uniref:Uncharacterized protein n=1 Tax=Papaver nudicaule TaxID=74823 RepID=A0AA41VB98_PAPNU|nr:hypothetical protein [Papaver nudicaule]
MVSFQEQLKFEIISQKKRRWEDCSNIQEVGAEKDFFKKISKVDTNIQKPATKSLFFDEYINFFRLEKPSDDRKSQSEKIQHYNTKNNLEKIISTTTACNKDLVKKRSLSSDRLEMGLDLELNLLPYESLKPNTTTDIIDDKCSDKKNASNNDDDAIKVKRRPSWMSFSDDQAGEMVAAACMRCHLLVMLSKSSPCCPNCKFMHPTDHKSSISLFKSKFSLKG